MFRAGSKMGDKYGLTQNDKIWVLKISLADYQKETNGNKIWNSTEWNRFGR